MKNATPILAFLAVVAVSLTCVGCDDDGGARPALGSVKGTITRLVPAPAVPPQASQGGSAASAQAGGPASDGSSPLVTSADGPRIFPVTDAKIVLVDAENLTVATEIIETDDEGAYRFDGLPPGEYAALVLHKSLAVRERAAPLIQIGSGRVTTFDINMIPFELFADHNFSIEGTVTDEATGDPVAGAHVGAAIAVSGELSAYLGGVGTFWATVTDSAGYYNVPALALNLPGGVGVVPLTVTKEGYEPNTRIGEGPSIPGVIPPTYPLPVGDHNTLHVDIVLSPESYGGDVLGPVGAIKGRLTYLGAPVRNAIVGVSVAFVADPDTLKGPPVNNVPVPEKTAYSDRKGEFFIDGLIPGDYWVDAAFFETDGYVLDTVAHPLSTRCSVTAFETCNVGDIELMKAISPKAPPNRSAAQDTTPEFSWTPVSAPSGMVFAGYNLEYGTGYVMTTQKRNIMETRWQMPDEMALGRGEYVRWNVVARAFNPASGDTVLIGEFEWPATFSVMD